MKNDCPYLGDRYSHASRTNQRCAPGQVSSVPCALCLFYKPRGCELVVSKLLPSLRVSVKLERSPQTLWSPVLVSNPRGTCSTEFLMDFWVNQEPQAVPLAAACVGPAPQPAKRPFKRLAIRAQVLVALSLRMVLLSGLGS